MSGRKVAGFAFLIIVGILAWSAWKRHQGIVASAPPSPSP